jgi:CRISPR-associated exonuclease Cas4
MVALRSITGTHIAYAFICKRKLWLFAHGIQAEHESDAVRMGRHKNSTLMV